MRIPRRALGFVYKKCNPKIKSDSIVKMTAFFDFSCVDSKASFPVITDLSDKLSGKNFELVIQPFPQPYNRNTHTMTKLMHVVNKRTEGNGVYPFMSEIFDMQDKLTTVATADKTDEQVLEILLPVAALVTNMSVNKTKEEFDTRSCDMAARLDFKYCCNRTVYKTPTFMLNDVVVDADQTWKLQDWLSVIDPLL